MRVCVLTHHLHNYTHRRLVEECRAAGLETVLQHPNETCWVWPQSPGAAFDLTFNRLSSVDCGPYERALSALPHWGRQVNPWELREKLWDKAHQGLWLSQRELTGPPSFMHQGPLSAENPRWRAFMQEFASKEGWVLKFNRGQKGVGVNFIPTEEALFSWLETLYRMGDQDFLIQPRLPHEAEYRLTLLGGKPWSLLRREGGTKANYAQGGSAEAVPVGEWPRSFMEVAEKLSGVGGSSYLALDILLASQGPCVLDVNTVPGVEQLEAVTGQNFTRDLVRLALNAFS